jgi:hypothetical protein
MSGGGLSSTTLSLLAGGTATASLVAPTTHVCELPKPVLFPTARSFIPPTADNKAAFRDLLTRLTIGGTLDHLLIVGHTDSAGDAGTNQALSDRRTQAVQAVLQGNTAVWDTLFAAEGWGQPELNAMVAEVGGPPTPRSDLFRRYFAALLGGAAVPAIQPTTPPLQGCGQSQLLHGSRSAPSRDTTLPPILGEFGPNRRVEFFFFDNSGAPISCSEYPRWTLICSLTPPPPPTITVTLSPLTSVGVNQNVDVQVTINPSPLPAGSSITLTLSTTSGTGSAIFTASGNAATTVTASGPVTIRGVTGSSILRNIHIAATQTGKVAVLAQEDFTVQAAISIFLKFEVWDTNTLAFVPLPAGVDVDIMRHRPFVSDVPLPPAGQTNAQGEVFFNRTTLGEAKPDIFFLVHTNSRAHAHATLPPEWSTKGWKAADGNPGFIPNYDGTPIGTPPASPRIFRIGLDFHARFTYLNPLRSALLHRTVDEPAVKGLPVEVQSGAVGIPPKATVQTDENGEVHGLLFNVSPGDDFSFTVEFEMTDASINLPRARVNDPSGWNTVLADADGKVLANNDRTSIGTQAAPAIFHASVEDRAHSFFMLKVLREWNIFMFQLTGGAWTGIENLLMFNTPLVPFARSISAPVGQIHIFSGGHFRPDQVAHELTHAVMWKEADFGNLILAYEGLFPFFGNIALYHNPQLLSNPEQALIDGWAEFIGEATFGSRGTPPFALNSLNDSSDRPTVPPDVGPPPLNRGELVEGAFANALWAIFQNHVVTLPRNAHVPDSPNGNIMATTAGAYLRDTAVRDRFLKFIYRPLQDLRPITEPTTVDMIRNIKNHSGTDWPKLHAEFQSFNLAMTTPTITGVSPSGGPPGGGNTVAIAGSEFTFGTTTVTIGGNAAIPVNVTGDTTLTVNAPRGPLGRADVVVTTPGGSVTRPGGYLYALAPVIASVRVTGDPPGTPARGPTLGGTNVTIIGTDFLPGAEVFFGGLPPAGEPATNIVSALPTQLTADSPRFARPTHSPGLVDVVVRNPDTQIGTLSGSFEYFQLPGPVIINVLPFPPKLILEGPRSGGTPLIIVGSHFLAGVIVQIGGAPANIDAATLTSSRIDILTPAAAPSVGSLADIRVLNPDGQDDVVPNGFTYTP